MIFIGGYMHSGTTMLLKILAKHSWIYALPYETRFLEYLEKYKKIPRQEDRIKKIYTSIQVGGQQVALQYKSNVKNDFLIPEVKSDSPISIFCEITNQLAESVNKKIIVEKTPTNIFFIPEIIENFKDSKIILIHRDVRQVLASKKERLSKKSFERYSDKVRNYKRFEKDYDPYLDCVSWKRSVKKIIENRNQENVYLISYTDLVLNPKIVLTGLCDWLEIPFEENILLIEDTNSADVNKVKVKGISPMSLESYKLTLKRKEENFITSFCRKEMEYLGYVVKDSNLKVSEFIYFWIKGNLSFFKRVYKRFRLMSFANFIIASKNYLKRR